MSSPACGKEQKVAYFGMVRSGMLVVKPVAPPPNVFSNRFAKAALPATVTVILLGWDSYKAKNDTIDPNLTCENYLKLQGWRPHVLQAVSLARRKLDSCPSAAATVRVTSPGV